MGMTQMTAPERTLLPICALMLVAAVLSTRPLADTDLRSDKFPDANYRRMAAELATTAGIEYRFGPSADEYGVPSTERPTAVQPSSKVFVHPAPRNYQVGGPQDPSKNDYSANQGQVGYIPASTRATLGVDHVQTLLADQNTYTEEPQLGWQYYGAGHPELDFVDSQYSGRCFAKSGVGFGRFVAQARAYSHGEATANSLVAFDNGVIAAAGTNTARGRACTQLPSSLHPSAISLTNGNEFALVTAWNTDTSRAELVVLALGGRQPEPSWDYEWSELYPGMSNYGMPSFIKVLGSIPLPVREPTSVSAVSDVSAASVQLTSADGRGVLRGQLPLSSERNRQTFIQGANSKFVPRAGYAVIASKFEKEVVFVDLQPLFERVTGAYFGNRAQFEATRHTGQGSTDWPPAFDANPTERPRVVTTVPMAEPPTAVAAQLSGAATPRAYVATQEGVLHVFDVGGLASAAPASATDVRQVGEIGVGRNPTGITYVKDRSGTSDPVIPQSLDDTLIVTCRGDREVVWVTLSGNSGSVTRTLRDSRLVDPIAAEDNNNHGTESYLLSVADYGAGRLFNYRYGPVIFHTNGGARYGVGPRGKDEFEFGGAYDPHGLPFSISVTNVT